MHGSLDQKRNTNGYLGLHSGHLHRHRTSTNHLSHLLSALAYVSSFDRLHIWQQPRVLNHVGHQRFWIATNREKLDPITFLSLGLAFCAAINLATISTHNEVFEGLNAHFGASDDDSKLILSQESTIKRWDKHHFGPAEDDLWSEIVSDQDLHKQGIQAPAKVSPKLSCTLKAFKAQPSSAIAALIGCPASQGPASQVRS